MEFDWWMVVVEVMLVVVVMLVVGGGGSISEYRLRSSRTSPLAPSAYALKSAGTPPERPGRQDPGCVGRGWTRWSLDAAEVEIGLVRRIETQTRLACSQPNLHLSQDFGLGQVRVRLRPRIHLEAHAVGEEHGGGLWHGEDTETTLVEERREARQRCRLASARSAGQHNLEHWMAVPREGGGWWWWWWWW